MKGIPLGVGVPATEPEPYTCADCILVLNDTLSPTDLIFKSQKLVLNVITLLIVPSL